MEGKNSFCGGCVLHIAAIIVMWPWCLCPYALALSESTATDGSNAQAVHALGITGSGIKIGLISSGNVRAANEAFAGPTGTRVFNHDYTGAGVSMTSHDTQVAGIVASAGGAMYPDEIGVAPAAVIHSAKVTLANLDNALDDLIVNQQCKVIVTVIQLTGTAGGTSTWTKMYDYYAQNYDVVFAVASGNWYPSITVFGDAYNGITTAGLRETDHSLYLRTGSASNSGPTADLRRKPEIAAPTQNQTVPDVWSDTAWTTVDAEGYGLTSYAVPHTAGAAALLLEYAGQTAEPYDGKSEVIKAVLVNAAFPNIRNKAGQLTYPAQPQNTWNADRGYGRIDILRAYQILEAGKIGKDTTVNQAKGWAYQNMQSTQTDHFYLTGRKNQRLVLTTTWHRKLTRYPATNYSEENPQFTLNITILSPSAAVAFSETDTLNNLEKADILLAEDGVYEIIIANPTVRTRNYATAFELLDPIAADFDANYIVDDADLSAMLDWWLEHDCGGNCPPFDIAGDEKIDIQDAAALSNQWLTTDRRYWPVQ